MKFLFWNSVFGVCMNDVKNVISIELSASAVFAVAAAFFTSFAV